MITRALGAESEDSLNPDFIWRTQAEKLEVVAYWWEQQRAICCICENPDLPMEPYHRDAGSNPMAASIEHLTAKRDGGIDSVGNVRLAHRLCNNALGALWITNEARAAAGLPALTREWALGRAAEQWANRRRIAAAIAAGEKPGPNPPSAYVRPFGEVSPLERQRQHYDREIQRRTHQAVEAVGRAFGIKPTSVVIQPRKDRAPRVGFSMSSTPRGLPRGATLPGYVPADDDPPPRRASAPPAAALLDHKAKPPRQSASRALCAACGSDTVTRDASMRWNGHFWIVAEQRESYDCDACQAETTIRWQAVETKS